MKAIVVENVQIVGSVIGFTARTPKSIKDGDMVVLVYPEHPKAEEIQRESHMAAKTIILGSTVKDVVTGFKGVVTGRATYLTGCDQYLVTPPLFEGKRQDAGWFDVQRLEVDSTVPAVQLDNEETPGADMPAPIK